MHAKRSMTRAYQISLVLLATLPVICMGYFWLSQNYQNFELEVATDRQTYIDARKHLLKNEVERMLDYINYEKSLIEKRLHQSAQDRTLAGYKIITSLDARRSTDTPAAKQQIRQEIAQILKAYRLDDSGDAYVIIGGKGEIIHTPFSSPRDFADLGQQLADGNNLVKEMVALAKGAGEGFLRFKYFKNENSIEKADRLVFLKYYQPLDLFVLSGAFVEDIEHQVQQEIIARLSSRSFDEKNTIRFVSKADGVRLVSSAKTELVGQASLDRVDAKSGEQLFKLHQKAALKPGGDFVDYNFYRSGHDVQTAAINFVSTEKRWGWMVGAGFFLDQLEQDILARREALRKNLVNDAVYIALFVALLVITSLFVTGWFTRQSRYGFSVFARFFNAASEDSTYIDKSKLPYSEFETLAESANRMIDERRSYEQALQQSELRFELALEHSRQFVWDLQVATGELKSSDGFFRSLGYDSKKSGTRSISSVYDIVHPDDRKVIAAGVAAAGENTDAQFRLRDSKGNYNWFYSRGGPVEFDEKGRATRMLGVLTDIGERKALEQELVSARISAEDANHAKSQFLASMSHELRTPLNGVLGYAQLMLRDENLTAEQYQYLTSIVDSGNSLLALISNILDLSMIESDVLDVVEVPCDLLKLSQSVNDIIGKKAKAKALQFETVIDDRVTVIYSDETKLKQILINLLSNAIKYTRYGSVRLSIVPDKDNKNLLFHVEDSGVGISADKIQKLFKPFQPSVNRAGDGAGLGLAICNRLAIALGGSVAVHSTLNQGSCFSLTIPLKLADQECCDFPGSAVLAPVDQLSELVVLVVGDDDSSRNVLVAMLRSVGVATVEAENGDQAVELLKNKKISAVIMDVQMLGLDAISTTAAIRQHQQWRGTVVIAVTPSAYDIEAMMLAGCNDYVSKPVNAKEIIEKLSTHLGVVLDHSFGVGLESEFLAKIPSSQTAIFSAAYLKELENALELGDVEAVRELLVTQQKACQKETYQQWLQHAIKCVDQLDLGGVADLLKQLRASEKAAL